MESKPRAPTLDEVMGKKRPEKKFKAGPISATIWSNETERDGKPQQYFTITVERSYQDKDGNWQATSTMRVNDLPKVSLVAQKAYEFLALQDTESIDAEDV
ncbi:hypothetical protein JXA12_03970 [Candidatus Woesearchaeota archaeon]|nr:hypothetical protein [Candidatus Woesearchaeota archaeon]